MAHINKKRGSNYNASFSQKKKKKVNMPTLRNMT